MSSGLGKSVNQPLRASGIYTGTVKRVDYDMKKVWCSIGRLTGGKTIGPMSVVGALPYIDQKVACVFTDSDDIVVIGDIQQVASDGKLHPGVHVQPLPPELYQAGQSWLDTSSGGVYASVRSAGGILQWIEIQSGGGSGGGTDEVWIGPDEPGEGIELWYDTAFVDPGEPFIPPRGVIGYAAFITSGTTLIPTGTTTLAGPISVDFDTDRLYRFTTKIRSCSTVGGSTNGTASWSDGSALTSQVIGLAQSIGWTATGFFVGDGTTKSISATITPGGSFNIFGGGNEFVIEDLGDI